MNLGLNKFNITKREVMKIIIDLIEYPLDVDYQVVNDSRDYSVSFDKLESLENIIQI